MRKELFAIVSIVCITLIAAAASINAQTYAGEAAAVKLVLDTSATNAVTTGVLATGPLPSAGGNINLTSVGTIVGGGIVSVGSSTVLTNGAAGVSNSQASVNTLGVTVLGIGVSADVVQATTNCACPTAACTGTSTIANLVVNGVLIDVSGEPNQIVDVDVGGGAARVRVIINERIISPGSITVNAIHITAEVFATLVETDIIIAQAHSGVTCTIVPLSNFYSGRAYGVWLRDDLLLQSGVSVIVADTGFLPTSGGNITVDTVGAGLPGPLVLNTGTVEANTSGGLPGGSALTSQSDASVEDLGVGLTVLGIPILIEANVIESNTQCNCSTTTPICTGDSELVGLTVTAGGLDIPVSISGLPNQHIELQIPPILPLVTLVLDVNNQTSAGPGDITQEALRIGLTVAGVTDLLVVVASSHSDIVCGLGPSAGDVSVSGRAVDAFGNGISNVRVTSTDMNGAVRAVRTNQFGNYTISELEAGGTYILDAGHKSYLFQPITISPSDDIKGVNLIANLPVPKSK